MRRTIRILANGEAYAAGHDASLDNARVLTFTLPATAADILTVDWQGYLGNGPITAAWTASAGTLSGETIAGPVASARLAGLAEGTTADITCTATAGSVIGVCQFRVACPDPREIAA
jgi:hypothetical protein